MVHADEVDIHLNPKIGPDRMLPGTQRLVLTPGNNEKRYLVGAYDPANNRVVYVEGDRQRLHFLPPYCPNENRLERLWLDLHANVTRNHRNRTIEALLEQVHGYPAERFDIQRRLLLVACCRITEGHSG